MLTIASASSDIGNNHIIPLSYVKFVSPLSFTPEKVNFVQEYGGFNLACGTEPFEFGGKYYNVFCLRYTTPEKHEKGYTPGNMLCNPKNKIPKKDIGNNFVWNNWTNPNNKVEQYVFLGQINPITGNILQVKHIWNTETCDLRLYKINFADYNDIYNYILCPRSYVPDRLVSDSATKYKLISLKPYLDKLRNADFDVCLLDIKYSNLEDCGLTMMDWNLPIYKSIVQNRGDHYNAELFYFKWYENNCVVEFSFNIQLPTYDMLNNYFINTHGSQDILADSSKQIQIIEEGLSRIKSPKICNKIPCVLNIKNNYLIGQDFTLNRFGKPVPINTHGFSMGTHFIDINSNISIAVGHIKIISREDSKCITYTKDSKPIKIQKKIYQLLTSLFGYTFKQHHSAFLGCGQGYSYLSYFIKYDHVNKTYHISDFFFTVDMLDKYHFSLLNTFGIMNINDYTYITSGEGDYYNSIMKFKTSDIVSWCKYDALDANFTIDDMNYLVILKDLDGILHTIVIDDQMVIPDVVEKHTGIKNTVTSIDGNVYGGLVGGANKYIYMQLKKSLSLW